MTFVFHSQARSWNMLKTGKTWNTLGIMYSPEEQITGTMIVKFENDTTINDTIYRKVWQSEDSLKANWSLGGFIREAQDTALYFRTLEGVEQILYKYNMNIGDSISIDMEVLPFVVDSIDSVLINGNYRNRYFLKQVGCGLDEIWIEGVGSLAGILNGGHPCIVGGRTKLLCYYEDEILSYDNINYDYCFYSPTTSIKLNTIDGFGVTIYPNPVNHILNIKSNKGMSLRIYDAKGILMDLIKVSIDKESQLNIQNYPNGIYFITSNDMNNTLKFIKD